MPVFRNAKDWLLRRADFVRASTERRTKNREQEKYNRSPIKALVVAAIVLAMWRLSSGLFPGVSVPGTIGNSPEIFHKIEKGIVFYSSRIEPPFLDSDRIGTEEISFPDQKQAEIKRLLSKYDAYWYKVRVEVPPQQFSKQKLAVILPLIWGTSTIFRGSEVIDFGRDRWPIISLIEPQTDIFVRVSAAGAWKHGMKGTYPPTWGDRDALDAIPKIVQRQFFPFARAEIIHLVIAFVFATVFLFSGWKPEVLAFLLYTLLSLGYGSIYYGLDESSGKAGSALLQTGLLCLLAALRSSALLLFALEFTRKESKQVVRWLAWSFCLVVGISSVASWTAHVFNGTPFHRLFQPIQEVGFILCSLLAFMDAANHLIREQYKKKAWRLVWFFLITAAILASQTLILIDYIKAPYALTSEYIRNVIVFILAAAVVIAELTRKDREHAEIVFALAKENRDRLTQGYSSSFHIEEGYLALIDGIDFTRRAEMCATPEDLYRFQEGVARHIAEVMDSEETSLLNGTGDGFLIAIRRPLSQDASTTVLNMLFKLIESPLHLSTLGLNCFPASESLHFRSALAYGSYGTGILKEGGLSKEMAASRLFPRLERICNGKLPSIHVLAEDNGRSPLLHAAEGFDFRADSVTDKKGMQRHFYVVQRKASKLKIAS